MLMNYPRHSPYKFALGSYSSRGYYNVITNSKINIYIYDKIIKNYISIEHVVS